MRRGVRLGLGPLVALTALAACGPVEVEVPIKVLLPDASDDLEQANNASITVGGVVDTFAVDGLDFEIELSFEPDPEPVQLSLFLADDEDLLAWGNTAPFSIGGTTDTLSLFAGRPGRLSPWPEALEDPDPDVMAAHAQGRGLLLLEKNGDTFLLSEYTHTLEAGQDLDDPPDPSDGGLWGDAIGNVHRIAWDEGRAMTYSPSKDRWDSFDLPDSVLDRGEPAIAAITAATGSGVPVAVLYVVGGDDETDAVALSLIPDQIDAQPAALDLDMPRPGASATFLPLGESSTGTLLVFGSREADAAPAVLVTEDGPIPLGDPQVWENSHCAPLSQVGDETVRAACLGGLRDGQPTAAAFLLEWDGSGDPEVEVVEDALPVAMGAPLGFSDDSAIYAQGGGRLATLPRDESATTAQDVPTTADRAAGGHSVTLATGASFLVGGRTTEGEAVDRWQVFTPTVPAN